MERKTITTLTELTALSDTLHVLLDTQGEVWRWDSLSSAWYSATNDAEGYPDQHIKLPARVLLGGGTKA